MTIIDSSKLMKELQTAGILIGGCDSSGVVWDADGLTQIQNRPDVSAIISQHDLNSQVWDDIRLQRKDLMSNCDWTQLNDAVLTFDQRQAWQVYRQALRDIPQTFATPEEVVWPVEPV